MSGQRHPKEALRALLLARRRALSTEAVIASSRRATDQLAALAVWRDAGTVGVYAAVRGELDLAPLWALHGLRRLAFPVVTDPGGPLAFFAVETPDDLVPGRYGIPSPDPTRARPVPLTSLDLLLLPGVAFDLEGYRLGLGKGYYDRTLPLLRPDAVRAGAGYEWQMVEAVPRDPWDAPVDLVVTESTVRWTRP